jgi:hypothetical protein
MSRTTLCGVANYPNSDCGVGTGVFNLSNSDFALLSVTQSQIRPCWQWHRARLFGVGRKLITQSQAQRCRQFRSTRLGCIGNYSEYDSAVLLITRMWRACNLTAFTPCLTGLVDHLFASRHEGPGFKTPGGTSVKPGFSCCIVSLHWWPQHDWSLWPRLRWASSKPSQGHRANNVDLTQLFCTGFMLTAGPPSGFTTAIVGCWGGALRRSCSITASTHSLTGPVGQTLGFPSWGTRVQSPGGYLHVCETGILLIALSRYKEPDFMTWKTK